MYRAAEQAEAEAPVGAMPTVLAAIVRRQCVTAGWNRDKVVLAPHIVYTRHGELFVDAITVARNNMLPREEKLGTFKLTGLNDLKITQRAFSSSSLFEPQAERYAGVTLMTVEAD